MWVNEWDTNSWLTDRVLYGRTRKTHAREQLGELWKVSFLFHLFFSLFFLYTIFPPPLFVPLTLTVFLLLPSSLSSFFLHSARFPAHRVLNSSESNGNSDSCDNDALSLSFTFTHSNQDVSWILFWMSHVYGCTKHRDRVKMDAVYIRGSLFVPSNVHFFLPLYTLFTLICLLFSCRVLYTHTRCSYTFVLFTTSFTGACINGFV